MLGRDVLVAHAARLVVRGLEQADEGLAERGGARLPADRGEAVERLVHQAADPLGVGAGAAQDGHDDPAVLLQQRDEQVLRRDLRVPARAGQPLRGRERLLGLDRETVSLHKI